jgi:hypothetical protein
VCETSAGNHARALEIADHARAALDTVDDLYPQSYLLTTMAMFKAMASRIDDARADAERGLELARRSGNQMLLASAYHATAWALLREDPAAALAAAEQYLDLCREFHIMAFAAVGSVMALAAGLRARLGDDPGALELLHDAIIAGRDQGRRPQVVAALDWALSPLTRNGRADVAATLLGGLTHGALAGVANFPGVDAARARALDRIRRALSGDKADELVARGAALSYDALVSYAVQNLDRPNTTQD